MDWNDLYELPAEWADTTSGRYLGPVRLRVTGDQDLWAPYVPLGRLLLGLLRNQITTGGRPRDQWVRDLPDGTRIIVGFDGTINSLTIVPGAVVPQPLLPLDLYMESGFIDARGSVGEFDVRGLWYPTGKSESAPYQDRLLFSTEGAPDGTFTGRYKVVEEGKSYALPGGKDDKRAVRARWVYPSKATGKLKLWTQALLGRAPLQDLPEDGSQLPLNQRTLEAVLWLLSDQPASVRECGGLVTLPEYTYWFVRIRHTHVYVSPVSQDRPSEVVRQYLLTQGRDASDEELEVLETYVLSGADCTSRKEHLVFTMSECRGEPIAYAWKFNKDGSQADMIAHELNVIEDNERRPKSNQARHYRLSFAQNAGFDPLLPITPGNSPLEVEFSILENVECTPRNGLDNTWVPDWIEYKMGYFFWCTSSGDFPEYIYTDAPIYCFYDAEDRYIEVRHELFDTGYYPENSGPEDTGAINDVLANTRTCDWSVVEGMYKGYETILSGGLYITRNGEIVEDARGSSGNGDMATAKVWGYLNGSTASGSYSPGISHWFTPLLVHVCVPIDPALMEGQPGFSWIYYGVAAYSHRSFGVFADSHDCAIVVPYFDSESVYIGTMKTGWTNRTYYYDAGNHIGRHFTQFWGAGHIMLQSSIPATLAMATGGGTVITEIYGYTENKQEYHGDITLTLLSKTQHRSVATHQYAEVDNLTEAIAQIGRWAAMFDPVIFGPWAYPYIDHLYGVQQSFYGDIVYYTDLAIDDYPTGVKTTLSGIPIQTLLYTGLFLGWT